MSSEKTDANQLTLFETDEPESILANEPKLKIETISYTRRKPGKRQEDLSKLPLEVIEHELSAEERECPQCGELMGEIGVDTRDEIKIIPAQVIHVQHRNHVYKCDNCARNSDKTPILKKELPAPVIPGSVASASAIAFIMAQKYLMHLPLYRLEQDFKRQGVYINRQNMANWVVHVCLSLLLLVYDKLREKLLAHEIIYSDDTGIQVLREPDKKPQTKSNIWLYRTGCDSQTPVAFYEYKPNRNHEHPENFLSGWAGFCHADGFAGYHNIDNVTVVGCWAHVRRKFNDAFKITNALDSPAKIGLDYCNRLFELERNFSDMSFDGRFEAREKYSKPVAEKFFTWAESVNMPPKLAVSRAITYALNQRKWLMNVFLDGRLELSNNRAERSIKPFVMGRKNWLFSNSVNGAKASAIAFTIIETAKENGLKSFEYLQFLLETLPNVTTSQIDELMPWSDALPVSCRNPK